MTDSNEHTKPRTPTTFVTFRLARVQNQLNAQATATLRANSELSLTEWRVLSLIVGEGNTSAATVSRIAQMDKGQVSRATQKLITRGYIRSKTSPEDHRQSILTPTPKAHETYEKLSTIMLRRQSLLTTDISDEEREAFFKTLDKLEARAKETVK